MSVEDGTKIWFVARDGKQTGPVSEIEIRAIAERGYFRASDLVWRPGFSEWRPALSVFPATQAAPPPPMVAPVQDPAGRVGDPRPNTQRPSPRFDGSAQAPSAGSGAQSVQGPQHDASLRTGRPLVRPSPSGGVGPSSLQSRLTQGSGGHGGPEQAGFGQAGSRQPGPGQAGPVPAGFGQPAQTIAGLEPTTGRPTGFGFPAGPGGPQGYRSPVPAGGAFSGAPANLAGGPTADGQPYAGHAVVPVSSTAEAEPNSYRASQRPRTNRMALTALAVTLMAIVGGVYVAAEPAIQKSGILEHAQRSFASIVGLFGENDGSTAELETSLQGTAHWPIIKREFPDWYGERLQEAAKMTAENKTQDEITKALAEKIVALRRQNAAQALAASPTKLMAVANAFLANLKQLRQASPQACYAFISQGELTPAVIDKLKLPGGQAPPAIQLQVVAIFEAIAEGRRSPVVHEKPQKNDYDLLMAQLGKLGWTQDDIATFANPRSLARAEPGRVCQMVQDWFVAHIAIENAETRQRLIGETLRPVVSG